MMKSQVMSLQPVEWFNAVPDWQTNVWQYWYRSKGKEPDGLEVHHRHADPSRRATQPYYLLFGLPPLFDIWPFTSSSLLSLNCGNVINYSQRKGCALALLSAKISHHTSARYLSTRGTVRATSHPSESSRKCKKCSKKPKDLQARKALKVTSGARVWDDFVLPKLLHPSGDIPICWFYVADEESVKVKGIDVTIEWSGRGTIAGGYILAVNEGEIIALYRPFWSCWRIQGREFAPTEFKDKYSSLGILIANASPAIREHVLLVCAAIEEQVRVALRFKRFQ
jgi:hypothetical protein